MNAKKIILGVAATALLLLLTVTLPNCRRARKGNTSPAIICISNLRLITSAKEQHMLETNLKPGDTVTILALKRYMGRGEEGEIPVCPLGGTYTANPVGVNPTCSLAVQGHKLPDEIPDATATNRDATPK